MVSAVSAKLARRSASCQNFQTGAPEKGLAEEQQLLFAGWGRRGSLKIGVRDRAMTVKPPNMPTPSAAMVFARAKSKPSVPEVIANIAGSISGEASQKAITAPSGAPTASSAAIKGITSQLQKGDKPPSAAAITTIRAGLPSNARASRLSAPLALR